MRYTKVTDQPLQIGVPVHEAFNALANAENEAQWHPSVQSARKLSAGPIGDGTEFEIQGPRGALIFRHDEFVPGERLGNTVTLPDGRVERWSATFASSSDGGTLLTQTFEIPLRPEADAAEEEMVRNAIKHRFADLNPHLKSGVEALASSEPTAPEAPGHSPGLEHS